MGKPRDGKISQVEVVLNHMHKNGGITSMEAFNLYKITRLAAVIWRIRHELRNGTRIKTIMCVTPTQYNDVTPYAKYVFETDEDKY